MLNCFLWFWRTDLRGRWLLMMVGLAVRRKVSWILKVVLNIILCCGRLLIVPRTLSGIINYRVCTWFAWWACPDRTNDSYSYQRRRYETLFLYSVSHSDQKCLSRFMVFSYFINFFYFIAASANLFFVLSYFLKICLSW